ncbi:MAG: putative baseplate assembly protein [Myxococcales bacterium]|nr:putative baseplate assembly protein [Myxococcales bacterium]
MIPSPKLDDRDYADLLAEALRLIPRYAPEWTNHNPSDPGITLLELSAWMADTLLKRVNKTPDKNYVALLNLLGISLQRAKPARTLLQFALAPGAAKQLVPRGTLASTPHLADQEPVVFETVEDVVLTSCRPDRLVSYYKDSYADHRQAIDADGGQGFPAFAGATRVDRYLYVGDPRFANTGDASQLRVLIAAPETGHRDLARLLQWEFFNGQRWTALRPAGVDVERGEVVFAGPLSIEPTVVFDREERWLRGRLAEAPAHPQETEMDTVSCRVEVSGEGIAPTKALISSEAGAFVPVELSRHFSPFGRQPSADAAFYVTSDELLAVPSAYVTFEFTLADQSAFPAPGPSDDLVVAWEYFDGKKWQYLGRTSTRGLLPGAGDEFGFHDESRGLSRSGVLSFRRPADMEPVDVGGAVHRWLRARIEKGGFGEQGNYSLVGEQWVYKDDKPLRPPMFRSISVRYREDYQYAKHVVAYNDFRFTDVSERARQQYAVFQPFTVEREQSPSLYLGFTSKPPNDPQSLYFEVAAKAGGFIDEAGPSDPEFGDYLQLAAATVVPDQRLQWEIFNGKEWAALAVNDQTRNLTTSGFWQFLPPSEWAPSERFGDQRYWLRVRLEMGGYVTGPTVVRLLTNSVAAENSITVEHEVLGSSNGRPLQEFALARGPVIGTVVLEVKERERPSDVELAGLAPDAYRQIATGAEAGHWVAWTQVDDFLASGPTSRHFIVDDASNTLRFGDGRRGMVPPEGRDNLVARRYHVGGGGGGNVNRGTITSMYRAIAYVQAVRNPIAATGGANRETLEAAKLRAPYVIRSRDRAVTAEDFEMLALRGSMSLARAKCVADTTHQGVVRLVVVPQLDAGAELATHLLPSPEVVRSVGRYLDERRLVGTLLEVVPPRYRDVSVRIALLRRGVGVSERLRVDIERLVRRLLHPLHGGKDGAGWEFGRPIVKSELIHLVEGLPGVDRVDGITLIDDTRRAGVEHVSLADDELPFVVSVDVTEKVRSDVE